MVRKEQKLRPGPYSVCTPSTDASARMSTQQRGPSLRSPCAHGGRWPGAMSAVACYVVVGFQLSFAGELQYHEKCHDDAIGHIASLAAATHPSGRLLAAAALGFPPEGRIIRRHAEAAKRSTARLSPSGASRGLSRARACAQLLLRHLRHAIPYCRSADGLRGTLRPGLCGNDVGLPRCHFVRHRPGSHSLAEVSGPGGASESHSIYKDGGNADRPPFSGIAASAASRDEHLRRCSSSPGGFSAASGRSSA